MTYLVTKIIYCDRPQYTTQRGTEGMSEGVFTDPRDGFEERQLIRRIGC